MTTMQEYKTFLGQVAKAAGLATLEPDDDGLVSLRVEDEYTLNLQFIAATGKILCFVEVAQLDQEAPKEAIYRELLVGTLFGKDTAGGYFSLEPESESVIYNYVFDADQAAAEPAEFADTLEKTLSLVDFWAGRIRDLKQPQQTAETAFDPRMDAFGLRI